MQDTQYLFLSPQRQNTDNTPFYEHYDFYILQVMFSNIGMFLLCYVYGILSDRRSQRIQPLNLTQPDRQPSKQSLPRLPSSVPKVLPPRARTAQSLSRSPAPRR